MRTPVTIGDVIALGANTLCGSEPEDSVTITTFCLDRDYIIDQVFWLHAALLADRLDAQDFADELHSEPAQVLHLGQDRAGMLTPWLDELVALSLDGPSSDRFYRLQALLFAVLDVITPYVRTTPVRRSPAQRKAPTTLVHLLTPLHTEARQAVHPNPTTPWGTILFAYGAPRLGRGHRRQGLRTPGVSERIT